MPHRPRATAVLLALIAAAPTTAPTTRPRPWTAGNHRHAMSVDGRDRSYLVHVPPGYDPAKPTPVVVAFHGALMNGAAMAGFTQLNRKSDRAGFIVCYPNGLGLMGTSLFFNASAEPTPTPPGPADDVRFTAAVLDDLATRVNVDPKRIFVTGLSNGGMMAHRVAAELSDRIAAVAPVSGTLAIPALHLQRPVPIMMFHGTADGIVPYAGPGAWSPAMMQFQSVDKSVAAWRAADGCDAPGRTAHTPDAAGDGTTVDTTTFAGPGGMEVILVRINGGGHTWPGGPPELAVLGRLSHNVSANDAMWDFFCRHPLP